MNLTEFWASISYDQSSRLRFFLKQDRRKPVDIPSGVCQWEMKQQEGQCQVCVLLVEFCMKARADPHLCGHNHLLYQPTEQTKAFTQPKVSENL